MSGNGIISEFQVSGFKSQVSILEAGRNRLACLPWPDIRLGT